VTRVVAAWERFWFEPESAATLALVRIAIGCLTLIWAVAFTPDLETFQGADGIVSGSAAAVPVHACLIAAAAGLALGYYSRISAAVAFGCSAWFHHVDPWSLNAGDGLLRDVLFLLVLAPAGAAFSIDATRRRRRDGGPPIALVPRWGVRLIQAQVSLMYLAAVAHKLAGPTWREGTAVSYPLRIPGMTRITLPDWLTGSPLAVHVMTWGVLGTEFMIGVLVWSRRARPWVLGAGVALHVAIDLTLRVGFLSWIVLATFLAFLPPDRAEWIIRHRPWPARQLRLAAALIRARKVD
jgi:hypothetical protein